MSSTDQEEVHSQQEYPVNINRVLGFFPENVDTFSYGFTSSGTYGARIQRSRLESLSSVFCLPPSLLSSSLGGAHAITYVLPEHDAQGLIIDGADSQTFPENNPLMIRLLVRKRGDTEIVITSLNKSEYWLYLIDSTGADIFSSLVRRGVLTYSVTFSTQRIYSYTSSSDNSGKTRYLSLVENEFILSSNSESALIEMLQCHAGTNPSLEASPRLSHILDIFPVTDSTSFDVQLNTYQDILENFVDQGKAVPWDNQGYAKDQHKQKLLSTSYNRDGRIIYSEFFETSDSAQARDLVKKIKAEILSEQARVRARPGLYKKSVRETILSTTVRQQGCLVIKTKDTGQIPDFVLR